MADIHSSCTDLPRSCRSAAEHAAQALAAEDRFAELGGSSLGKLTDLEDSLSRETGEKIALVAYRVQ